MTTSTLSPAPGGLEQRLAEAEASMVFAHEDECDLCPAEEEVDAHRCARERAFDFRHLDVGQAEQLAYGVAKDVWCRLQLMVYDAGFVDRQGAMDYVWRHLSRRPGGHRAASTPSRSNSVCDFAL